MCSTVQYHLFLPAVKHAPLQLLYMSFPQLVMCYLISCHMLLQLTRIRNYIFVKHSVPVFTWFYFLTFFLPHHLTFFFFFFFNNPAPPEISPLPLPAALPI